MNIEANKQDEEDLGLDREAGERQVGKCARHRAMPRPARVGLCYQFDRYRFYQLGPDNSLIRLITFVPITHQWGSLQPDQHLTCPVLPSQQLTCPGKWRAQGR